MRSRRFPFVVIGILALLHLYIGTRLIPALPVSLAFTACFTLLLAASTALIPVGLMSRSHGEGRLMDALTWAGLLLMGLFSSLLVFTFLRDVALMVAGLFDLAGPTLIVDSAIAALAAASIASLLGYFNARRRARVVDVSIPIADLPAALAGFTIAQISDIHVSTTIRRDYIEAIVAAVNELKPDVIAVTGDLVDGSVERLGPHIAPLGQLKARYGTYAVTGNHEYYSGAHAWVAELERLGLRVLMNEHVVVEHQGKPVVIAGITDFSAHLFDLAHRSDPNAAIQGAPEGADVPKILLAHQPRSAFSAAGVGFDVQLSGHTHGGQFWPWNHFVRFQQPFTAGLRKVNGLLVYISRGTGYWGPPKRFGAPSEITRITLVRA